MLQVCALNFLLCIFWQGLHADNDSHCSEASIPGKEITKSNGGNLKKLSKDQSDDDMTPNSIDKAHHREITVTSRAWANGALSYQYEETRHRRESGSPSKDSGKQRRHYDAEQVEVDRSRLGNPRKSSSESTEDKGNTLVHLPSHDRYHDELDDRSRSRSYDHTRERSSSRSVMEEEALSKRRRFEEGATLSDNKRKIECDKDDDRTVHHYGLDVTKDDDREHGTSYSTRYVVEDRYHRSRDTRDRERSREREVDRYQRREKEQTRIRDRDRRREKERERSRDRDLDRDGRREKARDWRDTEVDRARERNKERDRSRDRVKTNDRDRDSERERGKDGDRYSDRVMDRKRERRDDGYRDKGRDKQKDKFENPEDIQGGRDRYKHSRNSRHDERGYGQDRTRITERATLQSSKSDSLEVGEDKLKR